MFPELDRPRISAAVVVVVAHPDDETIGAGALLARMDDVIVVTATDGAPRDPAHPDDPRRLAYADLRAAELDAALDIAGVPRDRRARLGFVDQHTPEDLVPLCHAVAEIVGRSDADLILTHPYEGGHPDHDAVAFAVHAAVASTGATARILEMASYHADGADLAVQRFLPGPPAWSRPLDAADRDVRARMLAAHRSQAGALAPFDPGIEPIRRAPTYDFTQPPHPGPLWYERTGWADGATFRLRAREALAALGLEPACI